MNQPAERQPADYELRSPGEGVFRVTLFERSGAQRGTAFFTGENDREGLRLPPGDYVAVATDVGRNVVGEGTPLTLPEGGGQVDLSNLRPQASATDRRPLSQQPAGIDRRPSMMEGRATVAGDGTSKARSRPTRGVQPADGASSNVMTGSVLLARDPPRAFASGMEARSFDIALSEDAAPGSTGGWRAPKDIAVTARLEADKQLVIGIRDAEEDRPRRTRLRLSVAVQDRPALRIPIPLFRDGLEVRLRLSADPGASDVAVEVVAVDERVQGLVVALGDLAADEALSVLRWASGGAEQAVAFLADKQRDPWAAVAAAVALARIGRLEEVADWAQNLARAASHAADAHIVAAWATVGFGAGAVADLERQAVAQLARARRTGAPTFSVGNSLGLEILNTLRTTAADARVRRAASEEYARAKARSRHRVFRSPYMIWEQAGERLQGGRLVGARYLSVARGRLQEGTFAIDHAVQA